MSAPWRDRAGETYGPYRVLAVGLTRSSWRVCCTTCGAEYTKTTATLIGAQARGRTACMACFRGEELDAESPYRKRPRSAPVSPWPPDPTGLLQQEWIRRGFRV